jgi:hypothetical protein
MDQPMDEQPCMLVIYLYRRDRIPGSIRWHMDSYKNADAPELRVPGFVEREGNADQLSLTFAVPCSANGEIDAETQGEYEDLADERFEQLRPGQELA